MKETYASEKLYKMDRDAVVGLVERYRYSLLWFVTGHVKEVATAEDIVSDTVVRLLVKKPNIRSEGALKTQIIWLKRV